MVSQGTGSTYGSNESTTGMQGKTGEMTDQVKETAGQVTEQAKEQVGKAAEQAKEQATTRANEQKDRAATGLVGFADALNQVSSSMRDQNPTVANFADTAATRIESFASTLESRDVNELINEVQDLARRQPALFIGGAFLAGVFAARFLKSSGGDTQGYGAYGGYSGSTGYRGYRGDTGYGYTQRTGNASGHDTTYGRAGYTPQSSSQYGRPAGGTASGGFASSQTTGYGTTGTTGTTGTASRSSYGTTGGQDTPGAVLTGSGDTDASGRGIGTTGSTRSRSTTGTTGATGTSNTTDRDGGRSRGTTGSSE
jgi:uncharacterized protein YjbJ (UPF0337 family)